MRVSQGEASSLAVGVRKVNTLRAGLSTSPRAPGRSTLDAGGPSGFQFRAPSSVPVGPLHSLPLHKGCGTPGGGALSSRPPTPVHMAAKGGFSLGVVIR